ncbi:glycerophosphodiester phosphodiesterase [Streptococcus cameli]
MTEIVAHRGSRINRPENTLSAFEEAVRVHADGIELDVHLSQDGHVVVIHDETVNRTTDGKGKVKDKTLAQLKALDAGSWFAPEFAGEQIPTLLEVFELLEKKDFKGHLNIELKTSVYRYKGIEKKIGRILTSKKWPFKVMYSSFSLRSLFNMHLVDWKGEKAYLLSRDSHLLFWSGILPFIGALHLSHKWYFREGKKVRKRVRLWTVNDEEMMEKAFHKKVAAIITDKPERALELRHLMQEKS